MANLIEHVSPVLLIKNTTRKIKKIIFPSDHPENICYIPETTPRVYGRSKISVEKLIKKEKKQQICVLQR